jgi:hypothetical protein
MIKSIQVTSEEKTLKPSNNRGQWLNESSETIDAGPSVQDSLMNTVAS